MELTSRHTKSSPAATEETRHDWSLPEETIPRHPSLQPHVAVAASLTSTSHHIAKLSYTLYEHRTTLGRIGIDQTTASTRCGIFAKTFLQEPRHLYSLLIAKDNAGK